MAQEEKDQTINNNNNKNNMTYHECEATNNEQTEILIAVYFT